jgi:glutaredoxin
MKAVLKMPVPQYLAKYIISCTAIGLFALSSSLATTAGAQEIFRWVDKDGKVHYGDMQPPPAEGKNVQTKRIQDSVIEQDAVPYGVSTAMKNNPVTLYANSCGEACVNAKALLAKRGIPFTEKNPESDAAAATALKAMIGALQVPTIVIGANSLAGYEEESWNTALNAAGYPRNNPNLRQGAAKAGPKVVPPAPAPAVN